MDVNEILFIQLEPAAYTKDFEWQSMSATHRGIYHSLIIYLTCNGGKLISKPSDLCKLSNCSVKVFKKFWSAYGHKFAEKNGGISHKRVVKELNKAVKYRQQKVLAGKAGAKVRYSRAIALPKQSHNAAIAEPYLSKVKVSKVNISKECIYSPTKKDCIDAAFVVGLAEEDGARFYDHYAPQGFKWGNGIAMQPPLQMCLVRWRNNKTYDPKKKETTAEQYERMESEGRE